MPPMTPEKQEVEKAFKCFDTDNDGYLTKAEFRKVLCEVIGVGPGLTSKQFDATYAAVDTDHNGKVDINEFTAWLTGVPYKKEDTSESDAASLIQQATAGQINGDSASMIQSACAARIS